MKSITSLTLSSARQPSLPETVYLQLRGAILNGVLRPGEMLRQEELARSLGVSRAPLREALPRLEAEGIVVLHPRRGYAVVSLDHDEIREIFELRALIEERAVEAATRLRTDDDVATVLAVLEEMAPVEPSSPEELAHWYDLNFKFHDALVVPSGRRHFRRMITSLRTAVESYIRVEIVLTGDVLQAKDEHEQIARAFAAGDAAKAASLTRMHIEHTADRLLSGLAKDRDGSGSRQLPG